jgi:two-component system response regulator HydG
MKAHRIFLVNDDESEHSAYKRYFSKSEYLFTYTSALEAAKTVVASERFDAMILDLNLPDGLFIEWIPELRSAYPDMPIIIITGIGDIPTAVKAIKSGAENFLAKPVEMNDLIEVKKSIPEHGNRNRRRG